MESKFWVVWNQAGHPPTVKHARQESAEEEAKRLARAHPGNEFVVLEAVGVARRIDVEFRTFEDGPMPF